MHFSEMIELKFGKKLSYILCIESFTAQAVKRS